jgi:hypothetical protein
MYRRFCKYASEEAPLPKRTSLKRWRNQMSRVAQAEFALKRSWLATSKPAIRPGGLIVA